MPVNNVHSSLHHSFVPGAVRPGRTKGSLVMVTQLQTDVSKYRLVTIRPNDCRSHVVAKNGDCNTSIEAQHSIDAQGKIVGLLAMNSITENKTAKGKNRNKYVALDLFTGIGIDVVLFFTCKINHDHICSLVLKMHRQVPVFEKFI